MQPDAVATVVVTTIKNALAPIVARLGELHDRLSTIEARAPVAGPPGPPGPAGDAGRDGADGLGFDDLSVAFDGARTLTLSFARGDVRKDIPIVLPVPVWRGVFAYGTTYQVGDLVTHGGSTWHCQTATQLPPRDDLRDWQLMVKRGRDGRDRVANG